MSPRSLKTWLLDLARRTGLLRPAFRAKELAQVLGASLRRGARREAQAPDDPFPIPGLKLITLVAGVADAAVFLDGGRKAADSITGLLQEHGLALDQFDALLDFGCGCGRVIRRWHRLQHCRVHGSDYNPELIRWCREHLPFADFGVNGLEPPTAYDDASFDFIYALSVFTHLTAAMQRPWIAELNRILRPGGFLLFSAHGRAYLEALEAVEQAAFEAGRLVVRFAEVAGTNLCAAFHPETYVTEVLAPDWRLIDFVPEGARGNPRQDYYLLQKPAGPA